MPLKLTTLENTPEYRVLSAKQQFWLKTYIESNLDATFATQVVYTNGENARTMAYQNLNSAKVQAALARYQNKSLRQVILDQLLDAEHPEKQGGKRLKEIRYALRGDQSTPTCLRGVERNRRDRTVLPAAAVAVFVASANRAVRSAFDHLPPELATLPEKQRKKASLLIARKVLDGIEQFAEILKS